MRLIAFTGGECFLLGQLLDELIARATKHGLMTRCITNGYWASSPRAAKRRIGSAARAGLKEINISTGTFHSKYVPTNRVIFGALASVEAGLTTLINVEIFNDSDFNYDELACHPEISQLVRCRKLLIQRNFWIDNDGEAKLEHSLEQSRFNSDRIDGCKTALNVIAIDPDQDVIACCGLHMDRIPELHIGSVAQRSLVEALHDAPDDFLKIWIHVAGPERILQFVKDKVPDYTLPLNSVHPCETCLHLHKDQIAMDTLRRCYKEVEADVTAMFMAGIAQVYIQDSVQTSVSRQTLSATMG